MKTPPENVVVMTNLGPARFQNGCWFKWDLQLGRSQVVAHPHQEEFVSWSTLEVEPWMKTTWSPDQASPVSLCQAHGVGFGGEPLPAQKHDLAYKLQYSWNLLVLWASRKISWETLSWAFRDRPVAVCGRGGSYCVDPREEGH